jgi:hypothetical protein
LYLDGRSTNRIVVTDRRRRRCLRQSSSPITIAINLKPHPHLVGIAGVTQGDDRLGPVRAVEVEAVYAREKQTCGWQASKHTSKQASKQAMNE